MQSGIKSDCRRLIEGFAKFWQPVRILSPISGEREKRVYRPAGGSVRSGLLVLSGWIVFFLPFTFNFKQTAEDKRLDAAEPL